MPYTPTAGDRVRLNGVQGRRATIVQLNRLSDGAPYLKARVDTTGDLVWPNHVVADCDGAYRRECTDCEIVFFSDDLTTVLCPNCDQRHEGQDPGRRRQTGARRWRA
jgi:hypothetical protein